MIRTGTKTILFWTWIPSSSSAWPSSADEPQWFSFWLRGCNANSALPKTLGSTGWWSWTPILNKGVYYVCCLVAKRKTSVWLPVGRVTPFVTTESSSHLNFMFQLVDAKSELSDIRCLSVARFYFYHSFVVIKNRTYIVHNQSVVVHHPPHPHIALANFLL